MKIYHLNYQPDSAALFSHLVHFPYAFFLDSCGVDRFDIMVADPSRVFLAEKKGDDPFAVAKEWQTEISTIQANSIPEELPFTTGIMAYFSYDLCYELFNLKSKAKRDIELPLAVVAEYHWSIVTDHHRKITYFISQNSCSEKKIASLLELLAKANFHQQQFELTQKFFPNMNKQQYSQAFQKVRQHLEEGDCYQINLAERFTANYAGSPWTAYQHLQKSCPMPMASYLHLPQGDILCFSPERFLQVNNRQVMTQPIKGTRPRFDNPQQDQESARELLFSEKDRAENIMIVDLLRNDLSKCCVPGTVQAPVLCHLESFNQIHHLISTVTGLLAEDQNPFDLLKQCFPGGSITGAPKRRAVEIIDTLEPHQRSIYCGSIVYCDVRGRMDSNIVIRTLICHQQKIHCYGGGGIVIDSSVDSEYHEIQVKIFRLLNKLEEILCSPVP